MRTSNRLTGPVSNVTKLLVCVIWTVCVTATSAQTRYGLGKTATSAEIAGWDIDISPDGENLPKGSGTVIRGRSVYDSQCATCHGAKGEGGLGDKLAGGQGSLSTAKPSKTVGSYWPYSTTLFDYIRRAMPLNAPQTLSIDDAYAVSGYVLFLNGILPEDAVVNANTLSALKMPNRDGFIVDPRPDFHETGCTRDCKK